MKKNHLSPLVGAIALMLSSPGAQAAEGQSMFSFSGFGTVAAVHSSEDKADFTGNVLQPKGAGYSKTTSLTPDSKVGAQVNAVFNSKLSGVVQVVSQYRYDGTYTPQIEWANLKYQPTSNLSLRVGRIALPTYLMSESRLVGYAHTWARPPLEVYGVLPMTSNDGVDVSYRQQFGNIHNNIQVYYGSNEIDIVGGGTAKGESSWGVNDTIEMGSLTLRASYASIKEKLTAAAFDPLFAGMAALGETDMLAKYDISNMPVSAFSLGASYDPGKWFVLSEFVHYKGDAVLANSRSWYAAGGYRVGKFTPYLIHSRVKASVKEETEGGFLNGAINATMYSASGSQKTTSVGVRVDAMKNVAIKAQYDRVTTGDKSNGRFRPYPGYVTGSSADIVTLGVDFVF